MQNGPVQRVLESLEMNRIKYELFSAVSVEPTDKSMELAIKFARQHKFDAFVAVGGGSSMDTAKVANLFSSIEESRELLDFVNAPIGKGLPPPGPLKPLIAIPTTAGSGSETTGVAIFDYSPLGAKTGIAHRLLKPTIGLLDPDNTRTMHPNVAACSGFDVLCHALESYTAISYDKRTPRPKTPIMRPAYQGANPISDQWSKVALRMLAKNLPLAVENPDNEEARSQMVLAATFAGIGFGNAGVHLCV